VFSVYWAYFDWDFVQSHVFRNPAFKIRYITTLFITLFKYLLLYYPKRLLVMNSLQITSFTANYSGV